ncbi:Uncharacterised protein [uncultured archaeon]|nr:Uncharacterised protein [uncultured archaeon]
MMMRQIVMYLIAAITCMVFVSANPAFGAESSDLAKLVSQYHDNHMTVNDLAFYLATHNFDATPKDGYVQVTINGITCKVTPNSETGYAELMFN